MSALKWGKKKEKNIIPIYFSINLREKKRFFSNFLNVLMDEGLKVTIVSLILNKNENRSGVDIFSRLKRPFV